MRRIVFFIGSAVLQQKQRSGLMLLGTYPMGMRRRKAGRRNIMAYELDEVTYTDEAVLLLDAADFDEHNQIRCVVRHGECWRGSMTWDEVTEVLTLSCDSVTGMLRKGEGGWFCYEWWSELRGYLGTDHAFRVLSIVDHGAGEGS
jgi:hypothetical protein